MLPSRFHDGPMSQGRVLPGVPLAAPVPPLGLAPGRALVRVEVRPVGGNRRHRALEGVCEEAYAGADPPRWRCPHGSQSLPPPPSPMPSGRSWRPTSRPPGPVAGLGAGLSASSSTPSATFCYVLRIGCPWRSLPEGFPPWETAYASFRRWQRDGIWERLPDALRRQVRIWIRAGRDPEPSALILDSQRAKTTEKGATRRRRRQGGASDRGDAIRERVGWLVGIPQRGCLPARSQQVHAR